MIILDLVEQLHKAKNDSPSVIELIGHHKLVRITHGTKHLDSVVCTEPEHLADIKLRIGDFVSIAQDCKIFLSGNHNTQRVTTYLPGFHTGMKMEDNLLSNGHVTIGNDVWIGYGVTILSGVTIGDGAIIAANSTVTSDVEPYSIVGGLPAKKISNRFDQTVADRLLESQWWTLSMQELENRFDLIFSTNVEEFLKTLK